MDLLQQSTQANYMCRGRGRRRAACWCRSGRQFIILLYGFTRVCVSFGRGGYKSEITMWGVCGKRPNAARAPRLEGENHKTRARARCRCWAFGRGGGRPPRGPGCGQFASLFSRAEVSRGAPGLQMYDVARCRGSQT